MSKKSTSGKSTSSKSTQRGSASSVSMSGRKTATTVARTVSKPSVKPTVKPKTNIYNQTTAEKKAAITYFNKLTDKYIMQNKQREAQQAETQRQDELQRRAETEHVMSGNRERDRDREYEDLYSRNDDEYMARYQEQIDSEFEARKAAQIAGIDKMLMSGKSRLDDDKRSLAPKYNAYRQQTGATSQKNAKNFAEFMANVGAVSSGANLQGDISRQVAEQAAISDYNLEEQRDIAEIESKRRELETNADYDKTAIESGLSADRFNATLAAQEKARSNAMADRDFKLGIMQYQDNKKASEAAAVASGQQAEYERFKDDRNYNLKVEMSNIDSTLKMKNLQLKEAEVKIKRAKSQSEIKASAAKINKTKEEIKTLQEKRKYIGAINRSVINKNNSNAAAALIRATKTGSSGGSRGGGSGSRSNASRGGSAYVTSKEARDREFVGYYNTLLARQDFSTAKKFLDSNKNLLQSDTYKWAVATYNKANTANQPLTPIHKIVPTIKRWITKGK